MSKWRQGIITDAGLDLLARAEAGEKMTLTRVALGDGQWSGDPPPTVSALARQVLAVPILGISSGGTGGIQIRADVRHADVPEDFWLWESGVFARGETGDEILYAYNHAEQASFIDQNQIDVLSINLEVYIGRAQNVTAVLDLSVAYATIDMLRAVEEIAMGALQVTTGTTAGTATTTNEPYPMPMRTVPTLTYSNLKTWSNMASVNSTVVPSGNESNLGIQGIIAQGPTALTAGTNYVVDYTADAEIY